MWLYKLLMAVVRAPMRLIENPEAYDKVNTVGDAKLRLI